jgi:membrane-bound lytic murein transglycosylase B
MVNTMPTAKHLICGLAAALIAGPSLAAPPELSPRPVARAVEALPEAPRPPAPAGEIDAIVSRALAAPLRPLQGPVRSLRPRPRPAVFTEQVAAAEALRAAEAGLARWVAAFRPRALAAGITPATFARAARTIHLRPEIVARDRNQAEFSTTLWDYLDRAVSDSRIANGQAALQRHAEVLERIEARFGVEKEVVVAVWGMETNYGGFRGTTPILSALATLAHDGRRGRFFERQLIDALRIVQAGDVAPEAMTGSWAGAMGHTQFMPTSYLAYAVDFTGDGRRDIWSEDPTDALASTAAYLREFGWISGMPWGVEVTLPAGFDHGQARGDVTRMPSEWAALGVRGRDGRPVRDHGAASVLLPAGARGPAFLVFRNFDVIKRYNAATSYAMGVGHLSDRIAGAPDFSAPWPRGDRALTRSERKELQRLLTARGFDTGGVDGRLGPNSLRALRAYQRSVGLPADGYAHGALLDRLR